MVFKKKILRKIYGSVKDEEMGEWQGTSMNWRDSARILY